MKSCGWCQPSKPLRNESYSLCSPELWIWWLSLGRFSQMSMHSLTEQTQRAAVCLRTAHWLAEADCQAMWVPWTQPNTGCQQPRRVTGVCSHDIWSPPHAQALLVTPTSHLPPNPPNFCFPQYTFSNGASSDFELTSLTLLPLAKRLPKSLCMFSQSSLVGFVRRSHFPRWVFDACPGIFY